MLLAVTTVFVLMSRSHCPDHTPFRVLAIRRAFFSHSYLTKHVREVQKFGESTTKYSVNEFR